MTSPERVCLAVYDLSQGMAAALSAQVLGERIDGVWHTGLRLWGEEVFFGGGVVRAHEFATQNMYGPPHSLLTLGETQRSKAEWIAWLGEQTRSGAWTAETYDLLRHNCNHFTDQAVRWLFPDREEGIPRHIVELPDRVFRTPMGAALRPMFENMQNQVRQVGGSMDPFAGQHTGQPQGQARAAPPPPVQHQQRDWRDCIPTKQALERGGHTKWLLSAEAGGLAGYAARIEKAQVQGLDSTLLTALIAYLEGVSAGVESPPEPSEELLHSAWNVLHCLLSAADADASVAKQILAPTLFISRLLALRPEFFAPREPATNDGDVAESKATTDMARETEAKSESAPEIQPGLEREFVLERILAGIDSPDNNEDTEATTSKRFTSPTAIVLGIATIANTVSHQAGTDWLIEHTSTGVAPMELVLDVAVREMQTSTNAGIRRMASALLVNCVLAECARLGNGCTRATPIHSTSDTEELPMHLVPVLGAALEGLAADTDTVTKQRRMNATGSLVAAFGKCVLDLIETFGLADEIVT